MATMMACGCAAQGVCSRRRGQEYNPPIPACVIHDCIEVAPSPPDLTGRRARCVYFGPHRRPPRHFECNYTKQTGCTRQQCRCELPSDVALPFFEYRGPGSENATRRCRCGYFDIAHEKPGRRDACGTFEPVGDSFDHFYCGCKGWD